jgi:protein involved in polysaccharide export with SLBB domain
VIRLSAIFGSLIVLSATALYGQEQHEPSEAIADQPLATRAELQTLAKRLEAKGDQNRLARVRTRLTDGDFRSGERVLLMVQGEEALSDTFTVGVSRELILPRPTVGSVSMKGVLRSELQAHMERYLGRFLEHPVVQAQALIRLSVQGEVENGGIYPVPAEAALSDALMAAGGMTQFAKLKKIKIERNGERIWEGNSLDVSINALGLRDGDQIVVDSKRPGELTGSLRFAALIVSIMGGVYGLTRAF